MRRCIKNTGKKKCKYCFFNKSTKSNTSFFYLFFIKTNYTSSIAGTVKYELSILLCKTENVTRGKFHRQRKTLIFPPSSKTGSNVLLLGKLLYLERAEITFPFFINSHLWNMTTSHFNEKRGQQTYGEQMALCSSWLFLSSHRSQKFRWRHVPVSMDDVLVCCLQ